MDHSGWNTMRGITFCGLRPAQSYIVPGGRLSGYRVWKMTDCESSLRDGLGYVTRVAAYDARKELYLKLAIKVQALFFMPLSS